MAPCQTELKYKGITKWGNWLLDTHGIEETKLNNSVIYRLGLASDRKNARYEFIISPERIEISAERFGISPGFYFINNGEIHISSSIKILVDKLKSNHKLHISKRFLLEQNLFNYSLFDNTIFEEIKLLPSNAKAIITDHLHIVETFRIEDYFTNSPVPYKKCIHKLVDLFTTLNAQKIQDGDYISFTSGFDGRSLLALALSQNKKIHTYSFGSSDNIDLFMPEQQAERLGVDFYPVLLNDKAYINNFGKLGEEVITNTVGNSNLLQLHWVYAAKTLQGKTDTLVTGMFGSELFRAAHIAGQFTSLALVDYFRQIETDQWISLIKDSDSLKFLNKSNFINETDSLITDLQEYKNKIIGLSENQRFYKYIFDEIFRKFFGLQFIQPMRQYVQIVNPYLDFEFIKELLKTELAGINNDFFVHNPLKRFKGQLFYVELLKITSPQLFSLRTGKDYAPKDLHNLTGKLKIAVSFTQKRLKRRIISPDLDNLGIISGFTKYKDSFLEKEINEQYFNKSWINNTLVTEKWKINVNLRDKLLETISTNYYINSIK